MQIKAILISVIFLPLCLNGQPCVKYKKAMDAGNLFLATTPTPDYDKALIEFQAAQIAARECDIPGNEASAKLDIALEGLKKQRKDAVKAKALAEQSAAAARAALEKAEKMINAFYFFDGKLALSMKQDGTSRRYGFINKNGDPVIKYKYEKAEQFDYTGFARTRRRSNRAPGDRGISNYLVDTTGHEYLVDYTTNYFPSDSSFDNSNNLQNLSGIPAVDLRGQQLDSFPTNLFKYRELIILLLNNNLISKIPQKIGQLQNLKTLELSNNKLTVLPTECGTLTALKTLNISQNELTSLPLNIGKLSRLIHLNVSGNDLIHLTKEIGDLKNLQVLNVSFNELDTFPTELKQLQQLQILDISLNPAEHFPVEILELKNLHTLKMSYAHFNLSTINFKLLKNLHTLDIFGTNINVVPPSITQLKQLRNLYISRYSFTDAEYKRLRTLMPNCKIHFYPLLDLEEIVNIN